MRAVVAATIFVAACESAPPKLEPAATPDVGAIRARADEAETEGTKRLEQARARATEGSPALSRDAGGAQ